MRDVLEIEPLGEYVLNQGQLPNGNRWVEITADDRLGVGVDRLTTDHAEPDVMRVEQVGAIHDPVSFATSSSGAFRGKVFMVFPIWLYRNTQPSA